MEAERLWKQFNLTPDDATAVFCIQHGKCPICGRDLEPNSPATCGDHCHKTGAFRGWLCFLCNRAIGLLGDDVQRLIAATAYLKNPPAYIAIGKRYGTVGRKAASVPRKRRAYFRKSTEEAAGVVYRCGCSDSGPRAPKACPVHKQPKY
jgi:hypothetical protein